MKLSTTSPALLKQWRHIFTLSILLSFSFQSKAVNYYWVGNGGNWSDLNHWATSSGGTTFHTQIPTALDDVYFDGNSFTAPGQVVVFDALTGLVRDLNFTGVSNSPRITGDNLVKIYGSLTLVAAMDLDLNYTADISFESTSPGKTITMAGQIAAGNMIFNGVGGSWIFQDEFHTDYFIQLNNGTINTNDQTVYASGFFSYGTAARSLILGSSVINLTGVQSNSAWTAQTAGLTVNCGTSVINCWREYSSFQGGNKNYYDINFTSPIEEGYYNNSGTCHNVTFSAGGRIGGTSSFNKLTIQKSGHFEKSNSYGELNLTPGFGYIINTATTQTINGALHANGTCIAPILITTDTAGKFATIASAASSIDAAYVVMRDIHANGAASFTALNSTNLGNNTGWTINGAASQNFYWIGNGGNWDDVSHWSLTSGGTAVSCLPGPNDNVFFDANSFTASAQVVQINVPFAYCHDMNWTGVTNGPTINTDLLAENVLKIFGSLSFDPGMNSTLGEVDFEAPDAGHTITMAGRNIREARFNGVGGEWTFQDAFNVGEFVYFYGGTINSNDQTVNASGFAIFGSAPRTLNMGASVFNMSGASSNSIWIVYPTGFTLNSGTSVINCGREFASFQGGGTGPGTLVYYDVNFTSTTGTAYVANSQAFHNVEFASAAHVDKANTFNKATFHMNGTLHDSNSFDTLVFSPGYDYLLMNGKTQTVNELLDANGSCGAYITINSENAGSFATISHPAGNVDVVHAILKDIHATGGANFTANSSINNGNNNGWTFTTPAVQNMYWIGNGGNWGDGAHWSLTSGGPAAGCAPGPTDNVFFDANSFTLPSQDVNINVPVAFCRDMTWTGVTNGPRIVIDFLSGNTLRINGSLAFDPGMTTVLSGDVYFDAALPGQTITMAGKEFGTIHFTGNGSWTMLDEFTSLDPMYLESGTLNFNDQVVNASAFYCNNSTPKALNMGASVFNISGASSNSCWNVYSTNFMLNSGTSTINFTGPTAVSFAGNNGNLAFYDVNFHHTSNTAWIGGNHQFHDVVFDNAIYIQDQNSFHDVHFKADAELHRSNSFHNFDGTAGYTYLLGDGTTQTINGRWLIQGTCTNYIVLQTNTNAAFATVIKNADSVLAHNVHIRDIHCTGGANFMAYNSVDLGGNTGWNFTTLPPLFDPGLISGPSAVCTGSSGIAYHIAAVQGAIYYEWTVPAGATIMSGQGDTLIVVDFGTAVGGTISVRSYNGCSYGATTSALAINISSTIFPSVMLTANPGNSICIGIPVTFTASVQNTGGGTVTYDFFHNGVNVQSGTNDFYTTAALSDNDSISCTISVVGSSCFSSIPIPSNTIFIDSLPQLTPAVAITANPGTTICSGTNVTFTATASNTGSSSIVFDFLVNGSSVQSSSANTYSSSGLADGDIVSCNITISGAGNCFTSNTASSNTISISVGSGFTPSVSIAASPGTTVCPNTPVEFTATSSVPVGASINYDFIVNGNIVQSGASGTYTSILQNGDIVSCTVTVSGAPCISTPTANSNSIQLTVDPSFVHVNVNAGPDVTITAGQSTQLQGTGDPGLYLWSPGNDLTNPYTLNPVASPGSTTMYTLQVTDTVSGCYGFDSVLVSVTRGGFRFMAAITPNGDGINDKFIISYHEQPVDARLTIFNRDGRIVFQTQHYQNDWKGTFNGKGLPDGTYYFVVEYVDDSGKAQKERGDVTILR